MKRLFVGIPLPEEIKDRLKSVWDSLKEAGVKVVPLENLHLTLKFLGEVEESKIPEINSKLEVLAKNKPFTIRLKGIGTFGERQIRVVWVGVESLEIVKLMKRAGELLEEIYPEEHKDEVPHLTLARANKIFDEERLREVIKRYQKAEFGEFRVEKLYLYESKLASEGPVYTVVGGWKLIRNYA